MANGPKLLEAPLHHGFGEFFLGFEVVVDIAYRHASRLGDVRQTRLSETASIRQLRRSLNQPRSLVRLCRSHILRLGGVSYLTNSEHKPDAPVLSTPRDTPILGAGGWWTNPKGVGLNVSYVAKNSSTSLALLRTELCRSARNEGSRVWADRGTFSSVVKNHW